MTAYALKENTAEQKKAVVQAPEIVSVQGKKKVNKKPLYIKYTMIAVCFFAVLATIVCLNMRLAENASEISRLKTQMSNLKDEERSLNAKREQMYNLEFVEEYAKNVLGMVKLDKSSITYVGLPNEERISVAKKERNGSEVISGISKTFSIVLEYLN